MDRIAEAKDLVDGVELNVSCPNTDHGCMSWGVDPALTAQATEMARRRWDGPLWVKLTPQAPDVAAVAKAAESAGASAVVAANTWLGMAVDTARGVPVFSRRVAGLSGPAVFPLALRLVWDAAGAVKIPVIGCGGVDGPGHDHGRSQRRGSGRGALQRFRSSGKRPRRIACRRGALERRVAGRADRTGAPVLNA